MRGLRKPSLRDLGRYLVVTVLLALQALIIHLRAPVPQLRWNTLPPLADGTTCPQIVSWGPYRGVASYRITGEVTVHLALEIDARGEAARVQVTRVDLGAPDNGVSPDRRREEARRYLETVLRASVWRAAQRQGRAVSYRTDDYTVTITTLEPEPLEGDQG